MATKGCSRCTKNFPGQIGQKNFGGFDRESWIPRTDEGQRNIMLALLHCRTKTELERLETAEGTRYSVLIELPYYDAVKMVSIDPMHNLFFGKFVSF